jgi:hypothetical protein
VELFLVQFIIPACVTLFVALFGAKSLSKRQKVIAGLMIFVVAFIASQFLTHSRSAVAQHWVVAGTVEDETTREGIGQANVTLEGLAAPYITEDNGNFRIELKGALRNSQRVRIRVTKTGYKDYEVTLTPPKDNLTVLLQKL